MQHRIRTSCKVVIDRPSSVGEVPKEHEAVSSKATITITYHPHLKRPSATPHGDTDSYDDARRDGKTGEPILVRYKFSQTVPTSQGIPTQIRILSTSNDTLATVHGDRDVPPQRIDIDIMMDYVTSITISPTSSNVIALTFRLRATHEAWTFD
ncbi:hypothetical protein ColLi_00119 [Colletotrichum liriopes]|uniref:Uncharacterized protein n=1 Tax=Colletotrichum liriopes TaxID=708192 RepID=A0AA37GAG2_9PEZI|nr:hypothetical protein ColLi_00119 [Colletotrichum liriopes]